MERFGLQFLVVVLLSTLALVFFIFKPFLIALIMAAVFAVVLNPVYQSVKSYMRRWPSAAALVTVALASLLMLVPLVMIGAKIGDEATGLYISFTEGDARGKLTELVSQAESVLVKYVPGASAISGNLSSNVSEYSERALTLLLQNIGAAFSSFASFLLSFFVFVLSLYYLLRDGESLTKKLIELSPLRDSDDRSVVKRLEVAVNSVIKGTLAIALLQGFLSAVGFWIFGVPNGSLWGTVAVISALIPGFGTALVFIPAVIYLVVEANFGAALGLGIWGAVVVGGIDNFVRPYLIGSGASLHPLPILLSVFGGISFFGPVGVFLGPLSVALFFALLSIYSESRHYHE